VRKGNEIIKANSGEDKKLKIKRKNKRNNKEEQD
jgi:hypothetical protein